MDDEKRKREWQINNFRKSYENTQGGIFTKRTREKILTKEGISGRGQTVNTFWYRQRENVKTALIDLQLFAKEAREDNVEQVMNKEALRPLVEALIGFPYRNTHAQLRKAEIARLFINAGFKYLSSIYHNNLTISHQNTIREATDLADYLVEQLKPRSERRYPTYVGR